MQESSASVGDGCLRLGEVVVKRITVIKFRVTDGGGSGTGIC